MWKEIEWFGPLTEDGKINTHSLGDSYAQVMRYDNALNVYSRYIQLIRGATEGDHAWIADVEGWINDVYVLQSRHQSSIYEERE